MKRLHFIRANRLSQLHDELIAGGITPLCVEGKDNDIWLTVEDTVSNAAVQALVDAHVPAPVIQQPTIRELWDAFATAVNATNTPAALKTALTVDLKRVIKAVRPDV